MLRKGKRAGSRGFARARRPPLLVRLDRSVSLVETTLTGRNRTLRTLRLKAVVVTPLLARNGMIRRLLGKVRGTRFWNRGRKWRSISRRIVMEMGSWNRRLARIIGLSIRLLLGMVSLTRRLVVPIGMSGITREMDGLRIRDLGALVPLHRENITRMGTGIRRAKVTTPFTGTWSQRKRKRIGTFPELWILFRWRKKTR